eukprot:120569-Rhodomonas_salina.2
MAPCINTCWLVVTTGHSTSTIRLYRRVLYNWTTWRFGNTTLVPGPLSPAGIRAKLLGRMTENLLPIKRE